MSSFGAKGSPLDVKAESGELDGYTITRPCGADGETDESSLAVRGTGKRVLFDLASYADEHVKPVVWGTPGVSSFGVGRTSCGPSTIAIHLDDWREVDRIIAVVGGVFRETNVSVAAGLQLGPPLAILPVD